MSQIATVEMIYVAHSGRQYRAKHVQVHVGWELEDLEQKAKSEMSLREYAIQFTNDHGHKQFIMPTDLETIIVNVVAVTEERWEEPDYEQLQQKWGQQLRPYAETAPKPEEPVHAPDPERIRATGQALMAIKPKFKQMTSPVDIPDGEVTQSIKLSWGVQPPRPEQRVSWPQEVDIEKTQPMKIFKAGEVAGMSLDDATRVVQRVAAGGTVTAAED